MQYDLPDQSKDDVRIAICQVRRIVVDQFKSTTA